MNKNYLKHYGVKGMKWGVRKDGTSGSGSAPKSKNTSSEITDEEKHEYVSTLVKYVPSVLDYRKPIVGEDCIEAMRYIRESDVVKKAAEKVYPDVVEWKKLNRDGDEHDPDQLKCWDAIEKVTGDILKPLETLRPGEPIDDTHSRNWSIFSNTSGAIYETACKKYLSEFKHSEETEDMEQNELKHWGILGMKWGVRRSQKQLDKLANRKKAEVEDESFKTSKKKSLSKMSDDEIKTELNRRKLELDFKKQKDAELKQEVERFTLEKQYADLNPPKVSLGKKLFDGVWPTVKDATLKAGGTLLEDSLTKKGKELLGLNDEKTTKETNWDNKLKELTYKERVDNQAANSKLESLKTQQQTLAYEKQILALKKEIEEAKKDKK